MAIRSFADTSAVSIAYAFSNAANSTEVGTTDLNLIPFRSEGFTMAKEAQISQAITDSRRVTGSKNTKGSASGSVVLELGANPLALDFLSAALMSDWVDTGSSKEIFDGTTKKYMVVEKVIRPNTGSAELQSLETYYGTLANETTLEIGDGEMITLTSNTISANAEYSEAVQGPDGLGGSIAQAKVVPDPFEIMDGSNNVTGIKIYDADDNLMQMVFSSANLTISNNVREQSAVGHVFAAGIGMGKVNVALSGDVYYYDQSVLAAHMENKTMRAEITLESEEGQFLIDLPSVKAQSPSSNAQGENQDYMTSLELVAQEGQVDTTSCVIKITYTENPVPKITTLNLDVTGDDLDVLGVTANIADATDVSVIISDESNKIAVETATVTTDAFDVSAFDLAAAGFTQGDMLTVEVRILVNGSSVTRTAKVEYPI